MLKYWNFFLLPILLLSSSTLFAQCDVVDRLLRDGDALAKRDSFRAAINKYQSAIYVCSARSNDAQDRILATFYKIEAMRRDAVRARYLAEVAKDSLQRLAQKLNLSRDSTEKQRKIAEDNFLVAKELYEWAEEKAKIADSLRIRVTEQLAINQKFLQSLSFFDSKFALGQGHRPDGKFYFFMNQSGDPIPVLGEWNYAEPFESNGLARVKVGSEIALLDTFGRDYPLATNCRNLSIDKTAVAMNNYGLRAIPNKILRNRQIQVLLLQGNAIRWLPTAIARLNRLKTIDLSTNRITALPPQISNFTQLRYLNVADNRLSQLPPEIGGLIALQALILHSNRLETLPHEIGRLTNLRVLDLRKNRLRQLPRSIEYLAQLEELNLYSNSITDLPHEIGSLVSLKRLILSGNQLQVLPPEIAKLKRLKLLDIRFNPCSDTPLKEEMIREQMKLWLPECVVVF